MATSDESSPRGPSSGAIAQPSVPDPLSVEVLSQLVEQECALQSSMTRVLDLFHAPLAERSRGILTFAQHWALFANFGTLCEAHGRLCASLSALLRQVRQDLAQRHQAIAQQHAAAAKRRAAVGVTTVPGLISQSAAVTAPMPFLLRVASATKGSRAAVSSSPASRAALPGGQQNPPLGGVGDDALSTSPESSSFSLPAAGSMEIGGTEGSTFQARSLFPATAEEAEQQHHHVDAYAGLDDHTTEFLHVSPPPAAVPQCAHAAASNDEPSVAHARTASQSTAELLHPQTPLYHGRGKSGEWALSEGLLLQSSTFQTDQDEVSVAASTMYGGDALGDADETWTCDKDVLAAFCDAGMMHFLAEHMMYALHYAKTICPTLTELIAGVQSSPRGTFAPPLTAGATNASGGLEARGEAPLLAAAGNASQHHPQQLQHQVANGNSGAATNPMPSGEAPRSRVDSSGGGSVPSTATASMPTTAVMPSTDASSSNKDRYKPLLSKYRKFLLFTIHTLSLSREDELHLKRLTMPEEDPLSPHPKAVMDCGPIVELLLLLGSPLSSLQRLLLAVRSLVECQCLSGPTSQEVLSRFLLPAYQRSAEEGSMVLEQVAQQDVAAVLATLDDFNAPIHEGRVLLHSGHLIKKFRRGRHERLMFVFNDLLCYVEELSNGRNRVRGIIPLDTTPPLQVVDLDDDPADDRQFAFQLVLPAPGRSYLFFCTSSAQKRVWLDVLRFATTRLERAKATAERLQMTGDVAALVRTEVELLPRNCRLERQRRQDERFMRGLARAARRRASGVRSSHGAAAVATPSVQWRQATSPALTAASASQSGPGTLLAATGMGGRGAPSGSSHRRQASLRGSFAASELAAATLHERVRSSESFRLPATAALGNSLDTAAADAPPMVSPTTGSEGQNGCGSQPSVDAVDSVSEGRSSAAVFGPLFSVTRLPTKAATLRLHPPRESEQDPLRDENESMQRAQEGEEPPLQPLDSDGDGSEQLRIAAAVAAEVCAAATGEPHQGDSEA